MNKQCTCNTLSMLRTYIYKQVQLPVMGRATLINHQLLFCVIYKQHECSLTTSLRFVCNLILHLLYKYNALEILKRKKIISQNILNEVC